MQTHGETWFQYERTQLGPYLRIHEASLHLVSDTSFYAPMEIFPNLLASHADRRAQTRDYRTAFTRKGSKGSLPAGSLPCNVENHVLQHSLLSREVNRALKQLKLDNFTKLFEEKPAEIVLKSHHNAQFGLQSVVYKVLEQLMSEQFCEDVFGKLLDAHIVRYFDKETETNEMMKK